MSSQTKTGRVDCFLITGLMLLIAVYTVKYFDKTKDGKTDFVHTLNGTAVTSSRLPLALLEN